MRNFFTIAMILFAGCNSSSREKNLFHEAAVVHNAMVSEMDQIKHSLRDLSHMNGDSVKAILKSIEEWEDDLVEVPGNEHRDHQHDHLHEHQPPGITAEEMLRIQMEMEQRVNAIKMRIDLLVKDK